MVQHPRYVDVDKCIACGACTEKCPKKVPDEYNEGLVPRKAIYLKYAQAVPLKYAIDPEQCIKLTRGKCGNCAKVCPTGAVDYDQQPEERTLRVGAVVLADGTGTYDPSEHDTYGYRKNPDVVTSIEFERMLSASGPTGGRLVRPSDGREPRNIAWLQCVGSREPSLGGRGYCSSVCCTYAVKEAVLAKEHCHGALDAAVFYMDIRTTGKDFERYYERARTEQGVRFVKARISHVVSSDGTNRVRYVDEAGKRVEEGFDLVVLSVGLEASAGSAELARILGVDLDSYRFVQTSSYRPVRTSRRGVYVSGAHQAPKDIPSSVVDASAAAAEVAADLADVRWELTRTPELAEEQNVRGLPPRIGVFVCCCGTNIAGIVDVPRVVDFARTLPGVAYAEQNLFSCSQDTQDKMAGLIRQKGLNRVVVAACTPKTHEPLFQETLVNAGLSKYLFEMANIRNQCSWVHREDPEGATRKAKDLVAMSVAKARTLRPLKEPVLEIIPVALVIGGGIAGMEAARHLANQGYPTYLVEQGRRLGGHGRSLYETWKGEPLPAYVAGLIEDVERHPGIQVFLGAEVTEVDGFVGHFRSMIRQGRESRMLEHGVTIVATGALEYAPREHLFGEHPGIVTGLELERRLRVEDRTLEETRTAVFLQCVGSRIPERPYCSKVCCTQSIKNALALKSLNPDMRILVVYRDMRPYGLREDLYRKAREAGIVFVRYRAEEGFDVKIEDGRLRATFTDTGLNRRMSVRPDLLVLAAAVVPRNQSSLAQLYKISRNDDGFFAEAHVKLRPVDFSTEGIFVCGLAHAPKPMDESIVQAQAAAARASTLLAAERISVSGTVASVDPDLCSMCGVCASICPYSAPARDERTGKMQIQSTLCKGCGLCTASCRSGAIRLAGFDNDQILDMIDQV